MLAAKGRSIDRCLEHAQVAALALGPAGLLEDFHVLLQQVERRQVRGARQLGVSLEHDEVLEVDGHHGLHLLNQGQPVCNVLVALWRIA